MSYQRTVAQEGRQRTSLAGSAPSVGVGAARHGGHLARRIAGVEPSIADVSAGRVATGVARDGRSGHGEGVASGGVGREELGGRSLQGGRRPSREGGDLRLVEHGSCASSSGHPGGECRSGVLGHGDGEAVLRDERGADADDGARILGDPTLLESEPA